MCAGKHASLGIAMCAGNTIRGETHITVTPLLSFCPFGLAFLVDPKKEQQSSNAKLGTMHDDHIDSYMYCDAIMLPYNNYINV